MAFKRMKNAVLCFKAESTEGVYSTPTGTDALRCANVKISENSNNTTTAEYTASLDDSSPIIGGTQCTVTFDVYMKGNGAPGTAGPEWGKLLKSCGWTETLTAAAIGAPTPVTAGSTSTVTLPVAFAGADQLWRGMPLILSGTLPGAGLTLFGGTSVIRNFVSSTKVATLTDIASAVFTTGALAQIPANALYTPGSVSIPSGSMDFYGDGVLFSFIGARGTVKFSAKSGGPLMASFSFNAMFNTESDTGNPTPTFDTGVQPVWKNAGGLVGGPAAFTIDGVPAALSNWSLDCGNKMVNPDDPNANESFDAAQIISRDVTGSIDPYQTSIATRDVMADFRSMTDRCLHMRLGSVTGHRLSLLVPTARYTKADPGDNGGLMNRAVSFDARGNDAAVAQLCCY